MRGDRLSACRLEVDYGNGWTWESTQVIELDATATLFQRLVDFDVGDIDGAIAELDQLHSKSDAP